LSDFYNLAFLPLFLWLWFLCFLDKPLLKIEGFAQEEAMSRKSRCAYCHRRFVPNPRVKTQRFCANKPCQQARKAQWQREKMASDPDYQANQRDARRTWQHQHRDYWRHYRHQHPDYCERHRLLQTHRDHIRRAKPLAKMDAFVPPPFFKSGTYHISPATGEPLAKMDAFAMTCHLIPIT
jgi:hypothetical protein